MFCVQRLYDDHEGVHHAKFRSTDAISDKLTPPLTLSLTLSLSSVSIAGRLPPGDHDHDMSWAPYTLQHYLCWKPHESQRTGNARARANYDGLGGGRLPSRFRSRAPNWSEGKGGPLKQKVILHWTSNDSYKISARTASLWQIYIFFIPV